MERFKGITIIVLLASALFNSAALGKSASALLQEGLYAEEIEGDLDGAIKIYEEIITKKSDEKPQVAQAMYRLGMCHFKKRNEGQAKAVFERLVAEFPKEGLLVEKVQPLLEEMSNPDPAMLMPPETKIYVEFGSPGKQVETILNMLKGTPFENPLAAIGGGGQQPPSEQKTPGDIMAALLNPSMMAEFKKIRGMAIGITGIQTSNPPVVAVLFPGKSDALRGILLAALGVAGKPGKPIGDMQTVQIGNMAGAAYDDNAIIIAQPLEQLTWCAKQYKGVTPGPTLISENKVFAKLSRKMREDNAVTVWLDGAATFAAVSEQMTESGQKAQLQLVDGITDFKNIKELVGYLSLQESSITAEANVGFKDGHNCLAYDLIRTPNLSKDGFKAVPSQAVGVASFALGESEGKSSETAQKAVKKLTGLDIGREIFSNIEQITVFALPPKTGAESETLTPSSSAISCLGLTVTSRNPVQTCQLLTQLLTVIDLAANASMSEQSGQESNPAEGKYKIGVVNKQQIYCYIGQADNTTILALSEEVLEASLSALKSGQSVLTAGPLHKRLRELPGDTSKAVLVNAGGAIRIANSHINWAFENPHNPVHPLFAQLAQTCDKTSVQLRTGEKPNSFNLRCSLDEMPPLGPVFPLLMQAAQIDMEAKAKATSPEPAVGTAVGAETKVELRWQPGDKGDEA